jgi:23S rRNA (cytidine1920-2'-O)/16S rRNA (cytidine1409-2'-O)-methyltransferase
MSARRADIALVERGFFASRAKAREAIEAGLVTLDGRSVEKPSETVAADAKLEASAPYPWVSRGGVKLSAALDAFSFDPSGKQALDVGASTGGFTHVLLFRGATHVTCVDVGHGQINPLIANDPRVTSREKCDARALRAEDFITPPQLIVCDVSFISLDLVAPCVLALAAAKAEAVLLIKPQFEAGRVHVKKGLVRDEEVRQAAGEKIARLVKSLGWEIFGPIDSPIQGGDGNRELLLGARRT